MAKSKNLQGIEQMSFEDALEELKGIVSRLESGEGKLDEAIGASARGAELKRHCEKQLREAQEQIDNLSLGPDGENTSETFEAG